MLNEKRETVSIPREDLEILLKGAKNDKVICDIKIEKGYYQSRPKGESVEHYKNRLIALRDKLEKTIERTERLLDWEE